jgi:hypothetical protein
MGLLSDVVLPVWPRKLWGGSPPGAETPRSQSATNALTATSSSITHVLLEEHVLIGLNSADTQTRAHAARAVWHYARFGSLVRAQQFIKSLEARMRKIVLESKCGEDDGVELDGEEKRESAAGRKTPTNGRSSFHSITSTVTSALGDDDPTLTSSGISGDVKKRPLSGVAAGTPLTSVTGGLPSSTLSSSAKRVGSAAPPIGASTTTATMPGLKKTALGAPARVMMKKPPVAIPVPGTGKATPRPPVDASAPTDVDASDMSGLTHSRSHTRNLSSYKMDELQGLLNDTELSLGSPMSFDAPTPVSRQSPVTTEGEAGSHLRALSIQSSTSEGPITEIIPAIPNDGPAYPQPVVAAAARASTGIKASATAAVTKVPARKTAPPSAVAAATALMRSSHSTAKLPITAAAAAASSDPIKRKATAAASTSTAASSALRVSRRSLQSNVAGSTSRPGTRPQSRSASKAPSGRSSPIESESRTPITPRTGARKRSLSAKRSVATATPRAKTPTSQRKPVSTTPTASARPKTPSAITTPAKTTQRAGTTSAITSPIARPMSARTPAKSPARTANISGNNSIPKLKLSNTINHDTDNMAGLDPLLFSSSAAAQLFSPRASSIAATPAPAVGSVAANTDLAVLLRDHRLHLSDSAMHLQQLHSLLQSTVGQLQSPPTGGLILSPVNMYVDGMIHLLSDSLAKTTSLLEGFMRIKRKDMAAQHATLHIQQQVQAHATHMHKQSMEQQQADKLCITPMTDILPSNDTAVTDVADATPVAPVPIPPASAMDVDAAAAAASVSTSFPTPPSSLDASSPAPTLASTLAVTPNILSPTVFNHDTSSTLPNTIQSSVHIESNHTLPASTQPDASEHAL